MLSCKFGKIKQHTKAGKKGILHCHENMSLSFKDILDMEAKNGHGCYYVLLFCYLEIMKKIILLSQVNGSFSRDNGIN